MVSGRRRAPPSTPTRSRSRCSRSPPRPWSRREWLTRRGWRPGAGGGTLDRPRPCGPPAACRASLAAAHTHASVRSVWFINSLRGAVALAAAVAVADVGSFQHGFWVVLGTLSVLRTNAASTGATALRALAGTAIGFVVGGVLLVAIGSASTALWVVLPAAVFVAAYAPGTAPFVVGQAAFTVTVAVLFNLLAPVGWSVGVVRIEDVALGCAVSVAVGALFWPTRRGHGRRRRPGRCLPLWGGLPQASRRLGRRGESSDAEWRRGRRRGRSTARRGAPRLPRRAGRQAHRAAGSVAPGRRFPAAAVDGPGDRRAAGRCECDRSRTRSARAAHERARHLV